VNAVLRAAPRSVLQRIRSATWSAAASPGPGRGGRPFLASVADE